MEASWPAVAQRTVQGLGVEEGEVIIVRDHTGRWDVLQEMLLAIEQRGATPLPEIVTIDYLQRLLRTAPESYLDAWDQHRLRWMQEADRVLVLQGESLRATDAETSPEAHGAWRRAAGRLGAVEEERRLPFLLVGVPTETQAAELGVSLAELEEAMLPALAVSADDLQEEIGRVLAAVSGGRRLTILTGEGCSLTMTLGNRPWLDDDGEISAEDRERGGVVSNLPAGSVYTTIVEDATFGTLCLPRAEGEEDVMLHFMDGEVTRIAAASGGDALRALFARHTGDARRIGHVGIGLNPCLHRTFGWVLPDEHVHGCLFISLGENRYMGGQNASSLNVDFVAPNATLLVDDRVIVREGALQV
jgi:leucyl aminopeptidase (aminopeptidase T)